MLVYDVIILTWVFMARVDITNNFLRRLLNELSTNERTGIRKKNGQRIRYYRS